LRIRREVRETEQQKSASVRKARDARAPAGGTRLALLPGMSASTVSGRVRELDTVFGRVICALDSMDGLFDPAPFRSESVAPRL